MIEIIEGTLHSLKNSRACIMIQGIGFSIHVPASYSLELHKNIKLYTYFHWNNEQGPTLFGFEQEIEKIVFLLIIECPGIGPKMALSILSQISAEEFITIILEGNEKKLNSINGIGSKKAEQIIMYLKNKVSKLHEQGTLHLSQMHNMSSFSTLREALHSLGYNKVEINKALAHLTEQPNNDLAFDVLMRRALAFLSNVKNL